MKKLIIGFALVLGIGWFFAFQANALTDYPSKVCTNDGGTSITRTNASGNQYSECVFPWGKVCDESAYFSGQCRSDYWTSMIISIAPRSIECGRWNRCMTYAVSGSNETGTLYLGIDGFTFYEGNAYVLQVTKYDTSKRLPDLSNFVFVKELSRDFFAKVCGGRYNDGCNDCFLTANDTPACTKKACFVQGTPYCIMEEAFDPMKCEGGAYNDGCNSCTVDALGASICTLMYCENPGKPYCVVKEPTMCTMQFDPVCDVNGKQYGNACMAWVAWAGDVSASYCHSASEAFTFAQENGITTAQSYMEFAWWLPVLREQASKMFSVFARVYLGLDLLKARVDNSYVCSFVDLGLVGTTLKDHIQWSCRYGLFRWEKHFFAPKINITRAQALIVLDRITDSGISHQYFDGKEMAQTISRDELIEVFYALYMAK